MTEVLWWNDRDTPEEARQEERDLVHQIQLLLVERLGGEAPVIWAALLEHVEVLKIRCEYRHGPQLYEIQECVSRMVLSRAPYPLAIAERVARHFAQAIQKIQGE